MDTITYPQKTTTYLKIASFTTSSWFHRLEFFIEQNSNRDQYEIHPPKGQNFFQTYNALNWLKDVDFSIYNSPIIFEYFNQRKHSPQTEISEYLISIIVSTMYKYWITNTTPYQYPKNELEQKWVQFRDQTECYNLFDEDAHHIESYLEDYVKFYNSNNYENYIKFISKFEEYIFQLNPQYDLEKSYWELLLSELILKNLGRPFFINSISYGIDEVDHMKSKKYDFYFGNILQPQNLSLASHINFSNNSIDNFKIEVNWPWCLNSLLKSNIHKKISTEEYVTINLKDILKYSQNLINSRFKNSNYYFKNFVDFYECFIPIFSKNYAFQNTELNLENGNEINEIFIIERNVKFSSKYPHLVNDIKISESFIHYCLGFEKYLNVAPKNIYLDDFYLRIPFWEIPRIQSINLELFIIEQDDKYWDERIAESEESIHNDEYLSDSEDISDDDCKDIYIQSIKDQLDWDPNWRETREREMREGYDDYNL